MKTYNSTKENANSNRIVKELNASVLSSTFVCKEGLQKADLYCSKNSSNKLVAHGTCAPINCEYVETVIIIF